MSHPRVSWALILAAVVASASGAGPETKETTLRFVEGLRERGYHDLALEYLDQLRKAPDTPPDLKAVLDYEEGVGLAGEALTLEPDRREGLLEQARAKLEGFVAANPQHELAPSAMAQSARLLVERGYVAMLKGLEAKTPAEAEPRLARARELFHQARTAYEQAEARLKAAYAAARGADRDRAHNALMNAQLNAALVNYEEAQTFPAGLQRNVLLDAGIAAFKDIYDRYRDWQAGQAARMWQGKCYEEKGDLNAAMGIYNELMEHPDPRLRQLQRQVGYFRIIVEAKRKQYALAVDDAGRWLQTYPNARRTEEGLGVLLELAKNLLGQQEDQAKDELTVRRATDALTEVARSSSKHKAEAIALLRQYKPQVAINPAAMANLTYDEAMNQVEEAATAGDWGRAIPLLKVALRRVDPTKESDKANRARYLLAFGYMEDKHYYEAAVLAEHLARRYPKWELSAQATEVGLAALRLAYNEFSELDRASDRNHLIALASYTAETWPQTKQGDAARMTLGEIALLEGRNLDAAQAFESVRADSDRRPDAQARAGLAHWRQSLVLRDQPNAAQAEAAKAIELLKAALKTREDAKAPPTNPDLVANACDLADIHLAQGRPADALAVLDPLSKALAAPEARSAETATLYGRVLSTEVRAHVAAGQVDQAVQTMKDLEAVGGQGQSLTQLYVTLGKLLEKEMDSLKAKGDREGYNKTRQSYEMFLDALVKSQAGQSYNSMEWAGEALLALGQVERDRAEELAGSRLGSAEANEALELSHGLAKKAGDVFQRVIDAYSKDAEFQKLPNAKGMLQRSRIKLAAALRNQQEFDKAQAVLDELTGGPKKVSSDAQVLMEQGAFYEDRAAAGKGSWNEAFVHWKTLALRLDKIRPKPALYFEAWYRAAEALAKQGKTREAIQSLKSVMILSPTVGGAEMKARYQALLRHLAESSGSG